MSILLILAAFLAILVGLVHSILGEFLIFRHLRKNSWVPNMPLPPLTQRNLGILWATWHLASIFGFIIGAILMKLAFMSEPSVFMIQSIAFSMCLGSALVFYATKAKHPGWIGLLCIAILCWLA